MDSKFSVSLISSNDVFFLPEFISNLSCYGVEFEIKSLVLGPNPKGTGSNTVQQIIYLLLNYGVLSTLKLGFRFLVNKVKYFGLYRKLGINVVSAPVTVNSKAIIDGLRETSPDLIICILGGEKLTEDLYDMPKFGCINIHTGSLFNYRGLNPIFWMMLKNEAEFSVLAFQVEEGIDTGVPISQIRRRGFDGDTYFGIASDLFSCAWVVALDAFYILRSRSLLREVRMTDPIVVDSKRYFSFPDGEAIKTFRKSNKLI